MAGADFSTSTRSTDATTRIAALEAALNERDARIAERDMRIAELLRERDELRAAYDRLWLEVELMRRRIFIAKAERVDTTQLELEFKDKLAALDRLAGTLGIGPASDATDGTNGGSRPKPKGRRDLRKIKMPEERVEISDPANEALVAQGQAERIGFEESAKIAWQRGGPRRLVLARVKYRIPDANNPSPETTQIATAPVPPEIFPRAIASVSLIAHVLVDKYCDGLPFHRQEHRFARLGLPLDRGTMCRWAEPDPVDGTGFGRAGYSGDCGGREHDPPQSRAIHEVQATGAVVNERLRTEEAGVRSHTVNRREGAERTRNGGHRARPDLHTPDEAVKEVGHVKVAGAIAGQAHHRIERHRRTERAPLHPATEEDE